MLSFFARHRGLLVGGALTLIALGLLPSGGRWGVVGRSVGLVAAPLQALVRGVADAVTGTVDAYVLLVGANREADRLRREVAELKRELLAVKEVVQENERLYALLDFKEATDLSMVPARVVGRSASAWFRTLVIDRGSDDGVELDSPVLTPAGVVGRVYEIRSSASRVLLITDANSAVDALIQGTRTQVLVEGSLEPTCRALYMGRGEDVNEGDRVVTSGLGGVFPKGLLVGTLARVEVSPGDMFQSAVLLPSADFARLEEVFVGRRPDAPSP